MGIMDSVLSFAKSCSEKIAKKKGPNFVTELYHNIGEETKKMVDIGEEHKEEQSKNVEGR